MRGVEFVFVKGVEGNKYMAIYLMLLDFCLLNHDECELNFIANGHESAFWGQQPRCLWSHVSKGPFDHMALTNSETDALAERWTPSLTRLINVNGQECKNQGSIERKIREGEDQSTSKQSMQETCGALNCS